MTILWKLMIAALLAMATEAQGTRDLYVEEDNDRQSGERRFYGGSVRGHCSVLTIGVSTFVNMPRFGLQAARLDALRVARLGRDVLGCPANRVVTLLDGQVTKASVKQAIADLSKRTPDGDYLLLYVASHGFVTDDQQLYVVMYDTWPQSVSSLRSTAISASALQIDNSKLTAIEIYDVCRTRLTTRGVKIFTTGDNQSALETPYYGIYANALDEGLRGAAADAHGVITLANLIRYLAIRVPRTSSTLTGGTVSQQPEVKIVGVDTEKVILVSHDAAPSLPTTPRDRMPGGGGLRWYRHYRATSGRPAAAYSLNPPSALPKPSLNARLGVN